MIIRAPVLWTLMGWVCLEVDSDFLEGLYSSPLLFVLLVLKVPFLDPLSPSTLEPAPMSNLRRTSVPETMNPTGCLLPVPRAVEYFPPPVNYFFFHFVQSIFRVLTFSTLMEAY